MCLPVSRRFMMPPPWVLNETTSVPEYESGSPWRCVLQALAGGPGFPADFEGAALFGFCKGCVFGPGCPPARSHRFRVWVAQAFCAKLVEAIAASSRFFIDKARTLCQPRKGCGTRNFKCRNRSGEALRRSGAANKIFPACQKANRRANCMNLGTLSVEVYLPNCDGVSPRLGSALRTS